jgi:flavin-dependent dehydrogenase
MVEALNLDCEAEMRMLSNERWDAVVIGAGPAGAVAARLLALGGARVLLVERKSIPRRKVCGACWNASGLALLEALGAGERIDALGGVRLRRFHVRSPAGEIHAPLPEGMAVSRAAMDEALVQLAIEAGVCFQPNVRAVVGPALKHVRLVRLQGEGEESSAALNVEARVVIAADGLGHPSLCELPEFSRQAEPASRIGAGCEIAEFPSDFEAGAIHMAVGREGYVGLVVLETGALNVAAALAPALVRREGSLAQAASAVLREAGCPIPTALATAVWRGTPLLTRREPRLAATRLFLLGDAAGYAEPFTGEGMTWAVLTACAVLPLARQACEDWRRELAPAWTAMCRKMVGRRQHLSRLVAGMLRSPAAVNGAMHFLQLAPRAASPLVRLFSTSLAARAMTGRIRHDLQHSRTWNGRPGAPDESGAIGGAGQAGHLPDRPAGAGVDGPLSESGRQQPVHRAAS